MKGRKIIPLISIAEIENNERMFRRSISKNRSFQAWFAASAWIRFRSDLNKRKLSPKEKRSRREMLVYEFASQIFGAIKTRDARFFKDFAYFIERYGEPESRVRMWLAEKHFIKDQNGLLRCYTHKELLDDAERSDIAIDERQLRRLMKEMRFKFKHSHRK